MPTNVRDPRSFITPDAFEIDASLLGLPLAKPWRRLVALLIDLAVIGILTAVTSGLGVFIWGFVGFFLLQMAFRKPGDRLGQLTSVLFRGSTGCLGGLILTVVAIVGLANIASRNDGLSSRVEEAIGERVVGRMATGAFRGLEPAIQLSDAETRPEAEAAALALLEVASGLPLEVGNDDEGLAEALRAFMGESPGYTDDPDAFAEEMVARFRSGLDEPDTPVDLTAQEEERLLGLELPVAMSRYQDGLLAGRTPENDPAQALLRSRLLEAVAADTLESLQEELAAESRRRSRAEEGLVEARSEAEAGGAGVVALLRDIWEQAGSAVGLWSIYFTLTLTLFRGFTVGKRMMGIRVVRLDGERFTLWTAFERGGGYVAGIATGLLGFAQVFWDPNRQCVHDKIVGTAVVVAGAAPIPGAVESAWADSKEPAR